MRKRWFVFLLTLVLALSALPGAAAAAEAAAPPEPLAGGIVSPARGRLTRLGSLTQTETFDISAATRKAVGNLIVAGLKNRAGAIDVSAYGLTVQEGYDLYYEVLDAHYELFYVQSGFSYSYSGSWITSIQPLYDTTYSQSDVAAFNALCASIVAGIPQGTNAEKLLYLHDYLVTHCEYDLTYSRANAYNALVEGRAVCDGYSKAYKVLCGLAGLTCEFVSSQANNHSWNMVQVKDGGDTAWYYIDCTWDDPTNTAKGLTAESCCMHENFLLSKAECAVKHESGDWVNGRGESVYGYTTGTKYQNFWWRELIRPVQWVGTQMCYAKPDEVDQVFLRSSGAASETGAEIPGGGALWYVWDNPGSYYVPLSYITVASDGGSFYCSTPTRIWKLTPGGEMTLFYTLSSAEQAKGYLYGLQWGADGLIYYIGRDPMQSSVASGTLGISLAVNSIKANKTGAKTGEKITWTASASGGSGTLQYYFVLYQDGVKLKTRAYSTSNTFSYTPTEAGIYKARVYVKDALDAKVNKLSGGVTVTAAALVTITAQPANKTVAAGAKATFTVVASGTDLAYQWQYSKNGTTWTNKTGATSASYTVTAKESYNGMLYRCIVTNAGGSVTSGTAKLTVTAAKPVITTQPKAQTAAVGATATYKVVASGTGLTYQWQYSSDYGATWHNKTGATSASYTVTAKATYNGMLYRCRVKNSAGTVYSSKVRLTVSRVKPKVLSQPKAATAAAGGSVTFKVVAAGESMTYQWQYSTDGGTTWKNKTGATSASYTVTAKASYNGILYRCRVKNSYGTVYSESAKLTVS